LQWFVCLFTHRMPLPFAERVWDLFLAEPTLGLRALVRVGLALMAHYEQVM
jgi:hypothetical protein